MAGNQHHTLIVGSGFAGLCMGARLKQSGIHDFVILERSHRVGGVWRDNTYPGVACDIESHLYSFSFAPNPDWSRTFAPQAEILAYLERCVDTLGLRDHIRLNAPVTAARFDADASLWEVTTGSGETLRARVLVSGSGHALTRPVYPDIPGRETFTGRTFHSAHWDHDQPLDGKRVAVVGTGASAIQIIPSIAPVVSNLLVFQRTPAWVFPKRDRDITPAERARFKRFPALQRLARAAIYLRHELTGLGFHTAPRINRLAGRLASHHLRAMIPDPVLRAKLTPDYTLGCKRVLLSNDFYTTLCRPNVDLVTDPIVAMRPGGVVTRDGREHPVDAVVFATGFEAAEAHSPFEVRGRDGQGLDQAWNDGLRAYLGTAVPGFPNFFMILGPNTGLGHNSIIHMIESQVEYILDAIQTVRRQDLAAVEVRPEASAAYNTRVQTRLEHSVWNTGGCVSWYLSRSGRNTTLWPGSTLEFRVRTRRFDPLQYDLVPSRRPHPSTGDAAPHADLAPVPENSLVSL